MEDTENHELSAPYALDALSAEERREFEEHLARCPECRERVAAFHDTAAALAHGVEARQPPPELRVRILEQARSERQKVVPLRPRLAYRATTAAAAVAAIVAIGLGVWAASLSNELGGRPEAIRLTGADGQLVVTPSGDAALIVRNLAPPPPGKTYEAWVGDNGRMEPAGVFGSSGGRTAVALTRRVPDGALVAVTLEPAGGSDQPTGEIVFRAGGG